MPAELLKDEVALAHSTNDISGFPGKKNTCAVKVNHGCSKHDLRGWAA